MLSLFFKKTELTTLRQRSIRDLRECSRPCKPCNRGNYGLPGVGSKLEVDICTKDISLDKATFRPVHEHGGKIRSCAFICHHTFRLFSPGLLGQAYHKTISTRRQIYVRGSSPSRYHVLWSPLVYTTSLLTTTRCHYADRIGQCHWMTTVTSGRGRRQLTLLTQTQVRKPPRKRTHAFQLCHSGSYD